MSSTEEEEFDMLPEDDARFTPVLQVPKGIDTAPLQCHICGSDYVQPKILYCMHTFCRSCLEDYIPEQSLAVTCPSCRETTILPKGGVNALQDNNLISNFINNLRSKSEVMADDDTDLSCSVHEGEALKQYCLSCDVAICDTCDMSHFEHEIVPLSDAFDNSKKELTKLIASTREQMSSVEETAIAVNDISLRLQKNYDKVKDDIDSIFEKLSKMLIERHEKLMDELQFTFAAKQTVLKSQWETLNKTQSTMSDCCQLADKAVQLGNPTELLLVKKEVSKNLKDFVSNRAGDVPEQNDFLTLDNDNSDVLLKCLNALCRIETHNIITSNTIASGQGLHKNYAGFESIVTVTPMDFDCNLVKYDRLPLDIKIASKDGQTEIPLNYLEYHDGTYEISYILPREGVYKMSVKVNDESIKGSPYALHCSPASEVERLLAPIPKSVRAKSSGRSSPSTPRPKMPRSQPTAQDSLILQIGGRGRNKGEFTNPQGVCVTHNGRILATDSGSQCVQIFTQLGECVFRFGTRARGVGFAQRPIGCAVTANGNYLVTDYDNKCVSVYSPEGKPLSKFGQGKLLGPKGITVTTRGEIAVVDNKTSSVHVFSGNGKHMMKFGSRGNESYQLAGPHFITCSRHGDYVVSDFHNHCVKIFNLDGVFKYSIGSAGNAKGHFNGPTGVAVDYMDNILVADWGNSRVQVFDCNGTFKSVVDSGSHQLYGPQGLALSSVAGHVIVTDSGHHCLKVFKYSAE